MAQNQIDLLQEQLAQVKALAEKALQRIVALENENAELKKITKHLVLQPDRVAPCATCGEDRAVDHVLDAAKGPTTVALCGGEYCASDWPTAFDTTIANTLLPTIPYSITCVAVTELNKKAAEWIASSPNIRCVCIVNSVIIAPDLPPMPGVKRLMFLNEVGCSSRLQLAAADKFAATFPNLVELSVRYVAVDETLASLAECLKLQSLDLSWCRAITDAGLKHLTGLKELRELYLRSCNKITDAGLQHVSVLTSLRTLRLDKCHDGITDAGLQHVSKLTALRELDLNACYKITDAGLQHLAGLKEALQSLNLMSCSQITDIGLQHLQSLTALKSLYLVGCGGKQLTIAAKQALAKALPKTHING